MVKTTPRQRKTRAVKHLLHRVQTEETDNKKVLLFWKALDGRSCNNVEQTLLRPPSPEVRNFLRHFPAGRYLKYSCTKTRAVQYCTWFGACRYVTDGENCSYQHETPWYMAQVSYRLEQTLRSRLKNSARELTWPRIRPLRCPDLPPCKFCLWESLEGKMYKTNPYMCKN